MFQSCHWMWWLQHVFSGEVNASTTLCSWRLWRGDCVDDRSVVSGSGFVILVLPLKKLEWWSWMNHQWTMKRWKRWYDVSDGLKCRPSRPVEGGVSTPQPRESNSWCCLPACLSTKRICHVCLVDMSLVNIRCVRWDQDVDTLKVGIGTATALVKNKADEIKKDTVYWVYCNQISSFCDLRWCDHLDHLLPFISNCQCLLKHIWSPALHILAQTEGRTLGSAFVRCWNRLRGVGCQTKRNVGPCHNGEIVARQDYYNDAWDQLPYMERL